MARKPTGISEPDFYDFLETAWSLSDSQLSRAISFLEPLRENLSGWWSRRIDETNRIVYYEQGEIVYIISCLGHYDD